MTCPAASLGTFIPTGLEMIRIPNIPGINVQSCSSAVFYRCEQIFKQALNKMCEQHFKQTHPKVKSVQIMLRPEPENLCYYYRSSDDERLVVLFHENLRRVLWDVFQNLLDRSQTQPPEELLSKCLEDLNQQLLTMPLNKKELTLAEEKAYLTRIFRERYQVAPGAKGKSGKTKGPDQNEDRRKQEAIQEKMRAFSTLKYSMALADILTVAAPDLNPGKGEGPLHQKQLGEWLNSSRTSRILDLGCGTMGPEFFKPFKGVTYTGVDLVPVMSKKQNTEQFSFYRSDIEHLPGVVRKKKYDLILAINALESTTRPGQAIEQLTKILKDDGYCVVAFNQYEGSFLLTGNPFTFESLLEYCKGKLEPIGGRLFVTYDSPTGRDWFVILKKSSVNTEPTSTPHLRYINMIDRTQGVTIAWIEFVDENGG